MCQTDRHFVAFYKAEKNICFSSRIQLSIFLFSIRLIIKDSELFIIKHHVIAYYTVCKALYSYRNTL
jgi:hypothetical protein